MNLTDMTCSADLLIRLLIGVEWQECLATDREWHKQGWLNLLKVVGAQ